MKVLKLARGKYRLFFGFCPKCNSSAPDIYHCSICGYDTKYPASKRKRQEWYEAFKEEVENGWH